MMIKKFRNKYKELSYEIVNNEEFLKLKNIRHHGITRYDHCLRVSYYSYMIARFTFLDYKACLRAGLLHDFFLETYNDSNNAALLMDHPYIAVENSKKYFGISPKEEDIIRTHMFPVTPTIPKYMESWIVLIADDIAAIVERGYQYKYKLSYVFNFYIIFLFVFMK